MWRVYGQKVLLPFTVAVVARETVILPVVGLPPITGYDRAEFLSTRHSQRAQFVALIARIENRYFRLRQNVLHFAVVRVNALTICTLIMLRSVEYVLVLAPFVVELA